MLLMKIQTSSATALAAAVQSLSVPTIQNSTVNSSPTPSPSAPRLFVALASALMVSAFGAASAAAQSTDAETYENVIRPEEDRRAAAVAEIMARPSNWGPGEIRSNENYGAIAWCEKGGED